MQVSWIKHGWTRYVLSIGTVGFAVVLRAVLIPGLRETPYAAFYPAVIISALYGGFWPGLAALVLSGIASSLWFGPGGLVQFYIPGTAAGMLVFLAGGFIMVVICAQQKKLESKLRQLSRQYELTLQSAGDGIFGLDLQGNHMLVNNAALKMLGYTAEELMGRHSHPIWHHAKADGAPYAEEDCNIYKTLRDGISRHVENEVFWMKNGGSVPVAYTTTPIYEGKVIVGTVVSFRDITERKRAEEERERLIGELRRSNMELEQFAYVASHDLQEPLRMVGSYTTLLQKRYKEQLDEKAHEYIHYAVDGAERMQKLIEGLLAYSRITQRGAKFSEVDINKVFSTAVSNLSVTILENKAEITKEDLPVISGDEMQLVQLFQNLIGNSVKYRKVESAPRVSISAKREGRRYVFSVKDNGIGIEPEYYEKIFQIFQRLHTRDRYSGTGIGLALCKRIVERHHGQIWVESVYGEGSTFFFTVPIERK